MQTTNHQSQTEEQHPVLRAQRIFKNFTSSASLEEYLTIERFLFRICVSYASRSRSSKKERENVSECFYRFREIIKTAFECDLDSIESISHALEDIRFQLDEVKVDKNVSRIQTVLRDAIENYFNSDFFDADIERCELVCLFDQELERFLKSIGAVLTIEDKAMNSVSPGDKTGFIDLTK